MISSRWVGAVFAATAMLLFTAPLASALTKETGIGVEQPDGVWVGKAKCDLGETVVSGGFSMPDQSEAVVNKRKGDRTWVVKGQDTSGPLKVFAYCSRRLSPRVESGRGTFDPTTEEGSARARCAEGQTAVSGGWKYDEPADNQPVFTSYGRGGRAWKLVAASDTSSGITAYAYCLRADDVTARARLSDPIPDNGQGSVTAGCRNSEELLSGAFKTKPRPDYFNATGPDLFYSRSFRTGSNAWTASAHNYSVIAGRIKLAAICLG